jgi:sterol desaturase/sphingolipid hydroxylase (fatty acid hydroxylase superfamily)
MSYSLALIIAYIESSFLSLLPLQLVILATSYFLGIYLLFASIAWGLAKLINRPIEKRKTRPAQTRKEVLNSLRSILIFGIGMLIPWGMLKYNITSFAEKISAISIIAETVILILWNDVHFYAVHRLLHAKFKKWHATHHLSVSATPFAAYSMSSWEAMLLGSVLPIAMLFHHFSLIALILLPIWSIFINTLAHSNCDYFPSADERSLFNLTKHHQSHHSYYQGNFSFFFNQLDHWFNTSRPLDK